MKKIVLATVMLLGSIVSYSQSNNENKLIEKLVEKKILTESEAKDLLEESEYTASPKSSEINWENIKNLINNKYLQLGGYTQLLYSYNNTKDTKHDGSVRTAFLSIKGEPINKLRYLIFVNLRNPALTEYYIDWSPLKQLQFRVGQQKTPLSIENQLSLSALEFIQNTRSVDHLIGGSKDVLTIQNGKSSGGRDIGIKAYGNLFPSKGRSLIEYGIGIYQGSGINQSAARSDKDFIANILVSPIQGFRIGGGLQFGEAKYTSANETQARLHGRNRWLISADFKYDNLYARTEWIKGNDSYVKKEGIYGMCTWTVVPQKWILLGKVDYYNNDKELNKEVIDYSAGVNFLLGKYCRLQANYTFSDYSNKWGDKNSHLAEVQFQISY